LIRRWKRILGFFVVIIFVLSFVSPASVSAQSRQVDDMDKKCKATREGTETDKETNKRCAAYFEQTDAAGVTGAAAGAAASSGMGAGTIAAIVVNVAVVGAAIVAIAW
jgi:hypothetical protein